LGIDQKTMTTTREKTFSVGKYLVSPLITLTDAGNYAASVSIRSGRGNATHDRVLRFAARFATRDGARRYAVAPEHGSFIPFTYKELDWPRKN
jgi:hypothetical protein